VPTFR